MDYVTKFIRSYGGTPIAQDDQWITVKPNGPDKTGRPALIGEGGEIKAGMGGKFTGTNIKDMKKNAEKEKQNTAEKKEGKNQAKKSEQKTTKKQKSVAPKTQTNSNYASLNPADSVTGKTAEVASFTMMKPEESKAFQGYVKEFGEGANPPYTVINGALRSGKDIPESHSDMVQKMEDAFGRSKTTSQMTVYRGVSPAIIDKLQVGQSFTDNGFTSTSADEKTARSFGSGGQKAPILEIIVPKGSRAISMMNVPKDADVGDEKEIILNRGGQYRVVGIKNGPPKNVVVEYSGR